jgi:hypothetical protein
MNYPHLSSYIILELLTGAVDGFYKDNPIDVYEGLRKRHPNGQWVIVKVMRSNHDVRTFSEQLWHVNKLGTTPEHILEKDAINKAIAEHNNFYSRG